MINPLKYPFILFVVSALVSCSKQNQQSALENKPLNSQPEVVPNSLSVEKVDTVYSKNAPSSITRTIINDAKGNIWIASFQAIIKYDGVAFEDITDGVSQSRFFAVLQDSKDDFWFSSIGSGVYYYDGKSFQNFTTKDGLINDRVPFIYEDKSGNIWFGTEGGASRYDDEGFKNYTKEDGLPHNDVSSIVEDRAGKVWFGTREGVGILKGNSITPFMTAPGVPFNNVRSIIEDSEGHIWLGGENGLWRYDGQKLLKFSENFVGNIHEDKKGNIWTSSETSKTPEWGLSIYENATSSFIAVPGEVTMKNQGMLFGISEDKNGNMWVGSLQGVYSYDGTSVTFYKNIE